MDSNVMKEWRVVSVRNEDLEKAKSKLKTISPSFLRSNISYSKTVEIALKNLIQRIKEAELSGEHLELDHDS